MNTQPSRTQLLLPVSVPILAAAALLIGLTDVVFLLQNREMAYFMRVGLEAVLFLLLVLAWYREIGRLLPVLYPLSALFFFRLLYYTSAEGSAFWGLRAASIEGAILRLLGYGVGVVLLHPHWYRELRDRAARFRFSSGPVRWAVSIVSLLILYGLFRIFETQNISRDGRDWILRAMKPDEWYLYLREPLTIGLYRAGYLTAESFTGFSSREVIAAFSTLAGIWSVVWYGLLIGRKTGNAFHRILAFLLFFASGGLVVLFFGHIETYPMLIAGLLPSFYFAQRYMDGRGRIEWAAFFYAIAFLLHLSAGWLLPAFLILPFITQPFRKAIPDGLRFGLVFAALQTLFWIFVLDHGYGGSLPATLQRLHHDFNVGPDRAMFLPSWAVLHPLHLWDLLNEYLYLSIPACLLLPVALAALRRRQPADTIFWLLCAAFYLLYSVLWNPDRGLPEDWDLFSLLALLMVLFQVHVLLGRKEEECSEYAPAVYLLAVGTLPMALAQIQYHHTVFFTMP